MDVFNSQAERSLEDGESSNLFEAMQTRRNQRLTELRNDNNEDEDEILSIPELPPAIPSMDSTADGTIDGMIGGTVDDNQSRSQSAASSNLNMSIRERMRNRMKNNATNSDGTKAPSRKLRGLRERSLPNRFDESRQFSSVTEELDPYLKESIATTKEWKRLKTEKSRKYGLATDEEAFQFFTGSLDENEDEQKLKEVEEQVVSPDPSTVAIDIDDTLLVYNAKPEYTSHQEQMVIEEKIYHYPSSLPAPKEAKVPEGFIPRNLAEEGFYIGTPPKVPPSTLHRMENRLVAENELSWFDEDGNLNRLSNPLKEQSVRKVLLEDFQLDPLLQLDWEKAQISSFDTRYIDEQGLQHYQIDVDISMLRFTHHPFYSKEHVLEARLLQLYNHYVLRQSSGDHQHSTDKLEALRTSLKQLRNTSGDNKTKEQDNRILELQLEIRQLRKLKYNEEFAERSLLMNIFKTWQMLKKIRELQTYINTTSTIKVRKELTNKHEDQMRINEEINEELEEERVAFYDDNSEELHIYEQQLLKWKKYQRFKKRQSRNENATNEKIKDIPKVEKPVKSIVFDEEKVLNDIKKRNTTRRRKPGEPILVPELQSAAVVTPTEQCPRGELQRRAAMKNANYFVKVLFNDIEVSRTKTRLMSSDFTVPFGEILSIKILQWPESIKLQVYNSSPMNLLADIFAPLPESSYTDDDQPFNELEFSSDHVVQYRHEGVGCGMPIQFNVEELNEECVIPLTSGILYIATNWGKDENGQTLAPPNQVDENVNSLSTARHYDALAALGAAGMVDLHKLLAWIGKAKLDPNDPTNSDIVTLARMAQMTQLDNISGPKYFRLNQLEKETEFATKEELENNKRFQLIKLRDDGVQEFKHLQMIPVEERFVTDETFEEYEKRINFEEFGNEDEEFSQRNAVAKFLAKAREQVHTRSQLAKRQLDLEDIVVEEAIPDIGSLGARIGQIMEPRRPLKPIRKERKKIVGQNLSTVKDVTLLVNIVRAFDIPIRVETSSRRNALAVSSSGNINTQQPSGYNATTAEIKSMVRPFIEIMFQGHFLQTSVAEGAWPNWNEDLIIPFKAPNNDYSTDNLQKIKDKIYVNLFDEVIIDMIADERLRSTNVHQRIEKRWLGSIEIPFSTVYFNSKVDGFLEVGTPTMLLGYKSSREQTGQLAASLKKERTLIQMFVTIEPQLQPAPPMPEKFETSEEDLLVHNAQIWLTELRSKYPKREYKAMVSDLDGKKVFLTRFIHPQKPPNELILDAEIPDIQKMKLLTRFVSLIPYIADSVHFPDLCDIWTSSGQFLQMLAGDEEEHAVLLCNYFLWLGINAYLVLGNGIPEGSTAYVYTMVGSTQTLWNASSGESYNVNNVHCPFQQVACLINEINVYANIQADELPAKISFNIANTKQWKAFFSKAYPYPGLASIQTDQPSYFPIDTQYAINLQDKLERTLRDKLMEWRSSQITKFNRYCTQAFKNLLNNMESHLIVGNAVADFRTDLEQVLSSHQVTGFPLQMPYTDTPTIVERVLSTGVHKSEDSNIEFALAVHIHPYPNGVLAVWIYIGRLSRKTM